MSNRDGNGDLYPAIRNDVKLEFPGGRRPPEREANVKKARFSEQKIVSIPKQLEAGMKAADMCREGNVNSASFYAGKGTCGGLEVNEAQKFKRLREENSKLKAAVADLTLDSVAL